jgi:ABC-type antimicrobial peptide transport system permease subunit
MPGNPLTDPNWASDLTEQITTAVGKVRDTTTNKAIVAVRAVVYGLMALLLGIAAVVLLLIFLTRGFQTLLNLMMSWDKAVWSSYLIVGGILTALGMFLMSRRHSA